MLLFSSAYFVFLVALFFVYWPASRSRALSLSVILFANYFFYIKWDLFYLALIPSASVADYLIARGLDKWKTPAIRRSLVGASIALNLGILITLKYMPAWVDDWHWTFPLGVSFYTFQSLSYTIDVYRRDAKATPSLLSYLAAVSFFPTTLAGPITRPAALMPQLERLNRQLLPEDSGRAFFLIGLGLLKKLMIADFLADNLVNRVFDTPNLYSGFEVLMGVYGYALQLYYDFSGYTDIALGSALLLGLKLPANFNRPYAAQNIADFWRRWHISLSNWLRDYLYFSIPGQRTAYMPYISLMVTMALGGLWHGATWNFVIWGLLHGLGLAATRALLALRGNPKVRQEWWARLTRITLTTHFVCFAWIFFRASSFDTAGQILSRIASLTFSTANLSPAFLLVFAVGLVAHYLPKPVYDFGLRLYIRAPFYAQAVAMALLVMGIQYVSNTGSAPFIYTKF